MARLNYKIVKDKLVKMLSAWLEGAADIVFMGISRTNLDSKCKNIENLEAQLDDLNAQVKIVEDKLEDAYNDVNNTMVDVRNGVVGDANFGDDSALYGAMGFVRKSERRSGLTRKKKSPTE